MVMVNGPPLVNEHWYWSNCLGRAATVQGWVGASDHLFLHRCSWEASARAALLLLAALSSWDQRAGHVYFGGRFVRVCASCAVSVFEDNTRYE